MQGRWRRAGLLGVAVLAIGLVLLVVAPRDPDPLDAATDIAARDAGFATGLEAGQSLARIAEHLNAALEACRDDGETPCDAIAAGSGYAQVLAVQVLTCTAPGRFEARMRMADYLERLTSEPMPAQVEVPALPDC